MAPLINLDGHHTSSLAVAEKLSRGPARLPGQSKVKKPRGISEHEHMKARRGPSPTRNFGKAGGREKQKDSPPKRNSDEKSNQTSNPKVQGPCEKNKVFLSQGKKKNDEKNKDEGSVFPLTRGCKFTTVDDEPKRYHVFPWGIKLNFVSTR